jgi:periplasmic divalent cation tolerance protein
VEDNNCVIVLTTLPAGAGLEGLAATLVQEKLAACVNVLAEMKSIYRWDGKIENEREHLVVVKTTARRVAELEARLAELHPYQVPEFLVLPAAGGSERYLAWVVESTT